jgi:hypothetical protein
MQILHYHKKGPHLNTMEKFHIYTEYLNGSHLNDEHTIFPKNIFDSSRTLPKIARWYTRIELLNHIDSAAPIHVLHTQLSA